MNDLKDRCQWVVWRGENGRKIPYSSDGTRASTSDASTWLSYAEAVELASRDGFDGVGFVFTENDPFCFLDLDGCLDSETGELTSWASEVLERVDTYAEYSPSRTGLHLVVRGRLPKDVRHKVPMGGEIAGKKSAIEAYDRGRYMCFTGDHLDGRDVVSAADAGVDWLVGTYLQKQPRGTDAPRARGAAPVPDEEVLGRVRASARARSFHRLFVAGETAPARTASESDFELAAILAEHAGNAPEQIERLMRRSALRREKWDRPDYLGRSIKAAIERAGTSSRPETESPRGRRLRFTDVLASPELMEPPAPLVPFVAWTGHVALIAGREKAAGKSTFLGAAAGALTSGGTFLRSKLTPGNVLWVSADQEQWGTMALRHTRFFGDPTRIVGRYPDLGASVDQRLRELEADIAEVEPAWVLIDTLTTFALVDSPWEPSEWVKILMGLKDIARRRGVAISVVCHTPKDREDEYFGSVAIGATVDQLVSIRRMPKRENDADRRITSFGRLGAQEATVTLVDDHYVTKAEADQSLADRVLLLVSDEPGLTQRSICTRIHRRKANVLRELSTLENNGRISVRRTGREKRYYLAPGTWYSITDEDFAKARAWGRAAPFMV